MANKKISELPFGQLDSTSIIPIVNNGTTSQTTFGHMLDFVPTTNWYAENVATPTTKPIASGNGSIAFGNNAEALSNDMFIAGNYAGIGVTGQKNNFIGYEAGYGATNVYNSNFIGVDA